MARQHSRREGRGVIRNPLHPWNSFTGRRLGTMSSTAGPGWHVRLDNGIETFVLFEEWKESDG